MQHPPTQQPRLRCLSRRHFLLMGGATAVSVVGLGSLGSIASSGCGREDETSAPPIPPVDEPRALLATYPRKRVASLDELVEGVPLDFLYPSADPLLSASFVVKLGDKGGLGVGPDGDIVAFNAICPHMGGVLSGLYKHPHRALGPCHYHLTTFDLRKHGMVVAGHATESLPQVVLEVEDGELWATGLLGLVYGTHDSKQA